MSLEKMEEFFFNNKEIIEKQSKENTRFYGGKFTRWYLRVPTYSNGIKRHNSY